MPAELTLERCAALVMALDRGDAGQFADERLNAVDQLLRRGETGLDVDDQQCLAHEVSRDESPDATRPALGGPCR